MNNFREIMPSVVILALLLSVFALADYTARELALERDATTSTRVPARLVTEQSARSAAAGTALFTALRVPEHLTDALALWYVDVWDTQRGFVNAAREAVADVSSSAGKQVAATANSLGLRVPEAVPARQERVDAGRAAEQPAVGDAEVSVTGRHTLEMAPGESLALSTRETVSLDVYSVDRGGIVASLSVHGTGAGDEAAVGPGRYYLMRIDRETWEQELIATAVFAGRGYVSVRR